MDREGRVHVPEDEGPAASEGRTLGDVLYAGGSERLVGEAEWVALVREIADGQELALRELYERTNRIVFTLAVRITANRETAEEVTIDVFHEVWRRAGDFDPEAGTVVGWMMNHTRSRAIDRLRGELRKKRVHPEGGDPLAARTPKEPDSALVSRQERQRLVDALSHLAPPEREAIEVAFFSGLTYAETAERLEEPLGTIKTRIRSGLSKLRQALGGR
jgi:RNA polymerase sigma-70 factor, ECF subfamily